MPYFTVHHCFTPAARLFLFFIFLWLFSQQSWAQNPCPSPTWPLNSKSIFSLSFNDLENRLHRVQLQWVRTPEGKDSIYILESDGQNLIFIFVRAGQSNLLLLGNERIPRLLAPHHLRERLLDGPLRLEDFQLLTRPNFTCDTTHINNSPMHILRPWPTQLWSTLQYPRDLLPDSIVFLGWRREWHRTLYIRTWRHFDNHGWLPALATLHSGNMQASLELIKPPTSSDKGPLFTAAAEDTVFNRPWRPNLPTW